MKNIAKKNNEDYTVTEEGDAYASFRIVAEMCGVAKSTLYEFFRTQESDTKQGLTPKMVQKANAYYASKGRPEAINSLIVLAEAGAKAFIYNQAGLKLTVKSSGTPLDIMQQSLDILREQEEKLENHEDRLVNLEQYKHSRPNSKAGSYTCSKNYYTIGKFEKELLKVGKPLSNPFLRKFIRFYESEIRQEGEHCFHKSDVSTLIIDMWDRCIRDGALVKDPDTGFKFKADWLIGDL